MSDFYGAGTAGVVGSTAPGGIVMATSVPSDLKTLIRIIMRTFYGFELYLCMETLLAYPCVKEEDLADLLRLEAKQVHQNLVNLKKEKFVNERPIMETSGDGKQKSHSYYYINYKMMVNVIKYKLDKMRIQIETEEKQSTTRAVFRCSECKKTFSDLETKEIFFTMRCDHCNGDVEEDDSSAPSRSSRNLLAKLNTQLEVVFVLLQKLEHVRLADDILRPEPVDMTPVLASITSSSSSAQVSANGAGSGDKQSAQGNGRAAKYDGMNSIKWSDRTSKQDLFNQTRISINFDTGDAGSTAGGMRQPRELPSIILANQTTDDSINRMEGGAGQTNGGTLNRDSLLLNNIKKAANDTLSNSNNGIYANGGAAAATLNGAVKPGVSANDSVNGKTTGRGATAATPAATGGSLETIILQKLLIHEKKAEGNGAGTEPFNRTNSFISISKKRDLDTLVPNRSESFLLKLAAEEQEPHGLKRRRLNNGDIVYEQHTNQHELKNGHNYHHYGNQKSFSDGSDREMDEELDRAASGSTGTDFDDDQASSSVASTGSSNETQLDGGSGGDLMPLIRVQCKPIRLDRVTPKLIGLMSDEEKELYINVCRQLYTELYEI